MKIDKTNIMISSPRLDILKDSGKQPCCVCRKGVASNSISCYGCSHWILEGGSNIEGKLTLHLVVGDVMVVRTLLMADLVIMLWMTII